MRTLLCCIGLCLLASDAASQRRIEDISDAEAAYLRDELKNPETLRMFLANSFSSNHPLWQDEIIPFKQKFHVPDEVLRPILMDIYKSVEHMGKEPSSLDLLAEIYKSAPPVEEDGRRRMHNIPWAVIENHRRLRSSIIWLGYCADKPTKDFLMNLVIDDTKHGDIRGPALESYLRCANAQETRDGFIAFLDKRLDISRVYRYAIIAYDEEQDDTEKRKAIVATVFAALMKEEDKKIFARADEDLAARSKEYADSPLRKAKLERMNKTD